MSSGASTKILAVIPARLPSTRFPGKVIAPLAGMPLVVHVYQRTCKASLVSEVLVATDDPKVIEAIAPYGVRATLTRPDHASGTDRIAEAAEKSGAEIIVNVQGDEALIDPETIDAVIRPLLNAPDLPMATACHPITDERDLHDPNLVKVVFDANGRALYFSRSPIPCIRDRQEGQPLPPCYWGHIGLYAYRRDFLLKYAKMPPTPLEKLEKLEQLRVLENGYPIAVVKTQYRGIGVDTPEDLKRVERILAAHAAGEDTLADAAGQRGME